MRLLIDFSNTVGPWMGEICIGFFLLATYPLVRLMRKGSFDAALIFVYLLALTLSAQFPIWLTTTELLAFHWFLFTALMLTMAFRHTIKSIYGISFTFLAMFIVLVDCMAIVWGWPIQVKLWAIDLIVILMCVITRYPSLVSHKLQGEYHRDNQNNLMLKQKEDIR